MKKLIRRVGQADSGATAIEYALVASLIAMAIVGVLISLGPQIETLLRKVLPGLA